MYRLHTILPFLQAGCFTATVLLCAGSADPETLTSVDISIHAIKNRRTELIFAVGLSLIAGIFSLLAVARARVLSAACASSRDEEVELATGLAFTSAAALIVTGWCPAGHGDVGRVHSLAATFGFLFIFGFITVDGWCVCIAFSTPGTRAGVGAEEHSQRSQFLHRTVGSFFAFFMAASGLSLFFVWSFTGTPLWEYPAAAAPFMYMLLAYPCQTTALERQAGASYQQQSSSSRSRPTWRPSSAVTTRRPTTPSSSSVL